MSESMLKNVAVIMGSDSDYPTMKGAVELLNHFGIDPIVKIVSAHRTPNQMAEFAKTAEENGIQVIIAGAGGAAHLPGMVAAYTTLPVIGVPVPIGHLSGQDALLSIVQMPKGVPVATVAIGNASNAGILAAQIVAHGGEKTHKDVADKLKAYKKEMEAMSLGKEIKA